MTIAELKEKIKDLPNDMQVGLNKEEWEYDISSVENSTVRTVDWFHADDSVEEIEMFVLSDN